MTDRRSNASRSESTPTNAGSSATRRGFVALAGSAALAGCNALDSVTEDEPPTIDSEAYADALSTDPPTVAETLPVDIERSYLDASADRARESLASVPAPFDDEDVPNGAIRTDLSRKYEAATEELENASDAPSAAETMARLRDARESARSVAAGWEVIDDGLTRDDVLATVSGVRDDVDAVRRRWRYVGDDPVRAVLVHAEIEDLVAFAVRRIRSAAERSSRRPENPLAVGELAGRIEDARATLDDAEYLYDEFEASLDDSRPIRDGLRDAGEELVGVLDDRRAEVPDPDSDGDSDDASSFVDRDVEGTPVATALTDLYGFDYADGLADEQATGRRANAILSVHETLVRIRAFETLRERVANDEHVTVETADDVRTVRERAFEAVEDGLASGDPLTRALLSRIAGDFEYVEDRLDGNVNDDGVSVSWLGRDLGVYVLVGAMARVTPEVSEEVVDVIRSRI